MSRIREGSPHAHGAIWDGKGTNFSLFSANATKVEVCLFDSQGQKELERHGMHDAITSEILDAPPFYYAEDYHQQYLAKNPNGYCGLGGTGVSCPIGLGVAAE